MLQAGVAEIYHKSISDRVYVVDKSIQLGGCDAAR
jgi:hypothetical protein